MLTLNRNVAPMRLKGCRLAIMLVACAWFFLATSASASLTQTAFQFFEDDASESTATSLGIQNANTTWPANEALRARLQVSTTAATSTQFFLQYRKSTDTRWDTVGVNGPFPTITATSSGRTSGDTTSHSITLPSCTTGDLLLVLFSHDGVGTSRTTSSGWAKLGERSNGTTVTGALYWKFATGSDALTVTTVVSEESSHIVYCIAGAGVPSASGADGSSTNSNPPSHSLGVALNTLWIATRSGDSTVVATVAPSGFGSLITQAASSTTGASGNTAHLASSTATLDPGTFTSATEQWVSYTVLVPPAHTPTVGTINFAEGKTAGTSSNVTSIGSIAWTNPGNATTSNNGQATLTVSSTTASNYLYVSNFGFSIPLNATIRGVEVQIERNRSGGSSGEVRDSNLRLAAGGVATGTSLAATGTNWPTAASVETYGGIVNLWGTALTPTLVNASDFGVGLSVQGSAVGANRVANVDHIIVNVYYTVPSPIGLASSVHIASGAASSTSARMNPPAGMTTANFDPGRISDDTNPMPSVSIGSSDYSEFEWNIIATGTATTGDVYYLRLATGQESPLQTYSATSTWTIGEYGTFLEGTLFAEDGFTTSGAGNSITAYLQSPLGLTFYSTTTNAAGRYRFALAEPWGFGVTATSSGTSVASDFRAVTYGNGLFVAVGIAGDRVMTSPDGINWTARSALGNNDSWQSVTYGNGLFVAVGSSGDRVMTSPDGINWTLRSAAGNNDGWQSVTYGNGLFVAVATVGGDQVMTSPDGINWTVRSVGDGSEESWLSVTYGNGLFVAVGDAFDDSVLTSPDGITWTARSAAGDDDVWSAVTYGNSLFVAVGSSGNDRVMTSPDGITWTARSAAGNDDVWRSVAYGNGYFAAVGSSGDRAMTSVDGTNWVPVTSFLGNDDTWYGIVYGRNAFVGVDGQVGDAAFYTLSRFGEDTPITLVHDTGATTSSTTAVTITYGINPDAGTTTIYADLIADTVLLKKVAVGDSSNEMYLSDADFFNVTPEFFATTSTTTVNADLHIAPGTVVYAPQHLVIDGDFTNQGTFYPERGEVIADARTHDARHLRLLSDNDIETVTLVGIHVSPDGRHLHYWDSNERLEWYRLPVPFDTSSTAFQNATDTTALGADVRDMHFKPDGTALYTVNTSGTLFQFSLSTPWDVSTLALVATTSPTGGSMNGIEFNPEGTTMFIMDRFSGDSIEQWRLTTPWDITTATFMARNSASLLSGNEQGIEVNTQGTRLFVLFQDGSLIAHELTTPWDITTLTPYTYFTDDLVDGDSFAMMIDDSGSNLFISGATNDEIKHFKLDEAQTFVGVNALHDFTSFADSGVAMTRTYTLTGNYTNTGVARHDPNGLITLTSTSTLAGNLTGSSSLPAITATGTARVVVASDLTSGSITTSGGASIDASLTNAIVVGGSLTNTGTFTAPDSGTLTLKGNLTNTGTLFASTTDITFTGATTTLSGGFTGAEALGSLAFTAPAQFASSSAGIVKDLAAGSDYGYGVATDGVRVYAAGQRASGGSLGGNAIYTIAYDAVTGAEVWATTTDLTSGNDLGVDIDTDGTRVYVTGYCNVGCYGSPVPVTFTMALDAATGGLLWVATSSRSAVISYGFGVQAAGNNVYVSSYCYDCGDLGLGSYNVIAYNAVSGAPLWDVVTDPSAGDDLMSRLDTDGSKVFVTGVCALCGSTGSTTAYTVAYNALTGAELWATSTQLSPDDNTGFDVAVSGEILYVLMSCDSCSSGGFANAVVMALDTERGDEIWRASSTGPWVNTLGETVTVSGDRVFTAEYCNNCGSVGGVALVNTAFDAFSGAQLWSVITDPSTSVDLPRAVAVAQDVLYTTGYCTGCGASGAEAFYTYAISTTDGSLMNGLQTGNFANNASTTGINISASSTVVAPSALTVAGNFTQNGSFNAGSGTVYLSGLSSVVTGELVGDNALGTIVVAPGEGIALFGTQGAFINDPSVGTFVDRAQAITNDGTTLFVTGDCGRCGGSNVAVYTLALNPVSGEILWATTTNPGTSGDEGTAITVDENTVYVTGSCWQCGSLGSNSIYTVAYAKSTGALLWATSTDLTSGNDSGEGIAVDTNNVYVAATCAGCGSQGGNAYYTYALNKTNGSFVWATTTDPSADDDSVYAMTLYDGTLYLTGGVTIGGFFTDIYVVALDATDGAFLWSTTTSPTDSSDAGRAIAANETTLFIAGECASECGGDLTSDEYYTMAISRSDGDFIWATSTSPSLTDDVAYGIAIDDSRVYVTGFCNACGDDDSRAIYTVAYDSANGEEQWNVATNPSAGAFDEAFGITKLGGTLYLAGYCDGCGSQGSYALYVAALNAGNGSQLDGSVNVQITDAASTTGSLSVLTASSSFQSVAPITIGGPVIVQSEADFSGSLNIFESSITSSGTVGFGNGVTTVAGNVTIGSDGALTIGAGTTTISGDVTNTGAVIVGNTVLSVGGDLTSLAPFSHSSGELVLNGTATQVVRVSTTTVSLNQTFDNPSFPPSGWQTGGNLPWVRSTTTTSGGSAGAAEAGSIGDSQTSWLQATTTLAASSTLSFQWKSSTEAGWDFLVLCINRATCNDSTYDERISGEVDWTAVSRELGPGQSVIRFAFVRDSCCGSGQNKAWVDNVSVLSGNVLLNDLTVDNQSGDGVSVASVSFNSPVTTLGTFTVTPSSSAAFLAGATSTFQNVDWQGSAGAPVYLRSTEPSTQWYLDIPGSQLNVEYVNVADSNASSVSGGVIASSSTNAGNNTNWDFGEPEVTPAVWNATDWTLYDTITIDAANIDATLTDFPVYVDLSDLSSQFWSTTPAGASTVGTDIRVTNASNQELPRELVFASSTAQTGELHFRADSISSTTDTVFKIWYNGTTTGDYARDATYGTENVWTNEYVAVWHMNTDPASSTRILDSTSGRAHGLAVGTPTETSGKLYGAQVIDGSPDQFIVNVATTSYPGLSFTTWMNYSSSNTGFPRLFGIDNGPSDIEIPKDGTNNGYFRLRYGNNTAVNSTSSVILANSVHKYSVSYDRTNFSIYRGSDLVDTVALSSSEDTLTINRLFNRGDAAGNNPGLGTYDELRIRKTTSSAAWIEAEYLNQSTTTNFYTVGVGGAFAGTTTLANHDASQVNNAFSFQNVTNGALFAFKLTPESGPATTTNTVIALSGAQNVQASDFSNIRLLRDNDNDAQFDAGDTVLDATGVMTLTGQQGTITFDSDFGVTTTRNYLVVADWNAPQNGSFLSFDLWPNGLTIENATGTLLIVGDVASVQHRRNNQGGGGGSARIGGDAPAGDGVVGGGSNEGGEQIGSNPDFKWPAFTEGGWSNGANAHDQIDGTYATTDTAELQGYGNFDEGVPGTDVIVGIEVRMEISATTNAGNVGVELSWDAGSSFTSTGKNTGTLTTSDRVVTLGGPSDTWGRSWVASDFFNDGFVIILFGNPSANTIRLDAIQVRVYHQAGGGGQGGGGGGGAI